MNTICKLLTGLFMVAAFASCETDNYDEPKAGIQGTIYDSTTGQPLQTAVGKSSMDIRITELSFAKDSATVVTPQDLNMKQDGTYYNDKLFAGDYSVIPYQGPFYPLDETTATQRIVLENGKISTADFTVTPYLSLNWVKEPYLTDDGFIECQVKFTRNTVDGYVMPDVSNMQLYISHNQYCGPSGDDNYTASAITITNAQENTTITLRSKIAIKYSNKYWVRVGANCKDTYKKSNFTDIKTLDVTVK